MSEHAYLNTALAGATSNGQGDGCTAAFSRTHGAQDNGASGIDRCELRAEYGLASGAARVGDDYVDAARSCRDIYARHNWLRLEESLQGQAKRFETLPIHAWNRSVFPVEDAGVTTINLAFARA